MRIRDPKTTALIFASGKMVVTGAKSEDDSRLASRKYARIIQKLGFDAKFSEFKIQNIVGSCDVKFPIRLEGLAYSHGQFSSYEPEVVVLRNTSRATCLTTISPVIPWSDLPHDQAKSRASNLRVRKDRLDWRQGRRGTFSQPSHRSIDAGTQNLPVRFERRSTRLSTRSTLCFANFANHEYLVTPRRSCLDLHLHLHQHPPGTIIHSFSSSASWLLAGVHMMSLTMSCLRFLCHSWHVWNLY